MSYDPLHMVLRANRHAAGLSQAALAARMGTSQSVIARAESGRGPAHTLSFLERFATATGRSLTTTIVPGRPAPPSTEELHRLAGRIRAAATARGIQQVRVVGSVARGTARAESDVDLMVTVSPALKGARYFAALDEFREACVGIVRRSVDVIDQAGVQDLRTRKRLLREARVL
jgi:predicted nucleotidyltransferase